MIRPILLAESVVAGERLRHQHPELFADAVVVSSRTMYRVAGRTVDTVWVQTFAAFASGYASAVNLLRLARLRCGHDRTLRFFSGDPAEWTEA